MRPGGGGSRKKRRELKVQPERQLTPAEQDLAAAQDELSRWLTRGPNHPLAGQFCPSPGGIAIFCVVSYVCRILPSYCWKIIMPPLAFGMTCLMFVCCPHPAKPILVVFAWNHGLRAAWWLWLGPMPFILFFMGMSFTLIPCFGKKPHLWSPTGGALVGAIAFKFGQRVAYDCHVPERDCNYSGGPPDQDDALCEIEQDVLFLDLGSDGYVWPERLLLLLLVVMVFVASTRQVFDLEAIAAQEKGPRQQEKQR